MKLLRHYGRTLVTVAPGRTAIRLHDGKVIEGQPLDELSYYARAWALGYQGNAVAMCEDHDPLHALLAHALGLPESPALRAVADGHPPSVLTGAEEDFVLAAQRFLQLVRRSGLVEPAHTLPPLV